MNSWNRWNIQLQTESEVKLERGEEGKRWPGWLMLSLDEEEGDVPPGKSRAKTDKCWVFSDGSFWVYSLLHFQEWLRYVISWQAALSLRACCSCVLLWTESFEDFQKDLTHIKTLSANLDWNCGLVCCGWRAHVDRKLFIIELRGVRTNVWLLTGCSYSTLHTFHT